MRLPARLWRYGEASYEYGSRSPRVSKKVFSPSRSRRLIQVTAFSKKTGDHGVLSLADIHILALTYELECELNHGDWRLFKEPGSVTDIY
jgi:RNA-binding protein NOB1